MMNLARESAGVGHRASIALRRRETIDTCRTASGRHQELVSVYPGST